MVWSYIAIEEAETNSQFCDPFVTIWLAKVPMGLINFEYIKPDAQYTAS